MKKITPLQVRKFFLSILLVLLSTVIFSIAIIASPQSERIVQNSRFDLNKTEAWKKEYKLALDIMNEDLLLKEKKVEETKKIIFKRLNDFGVDEVTIVSEEGATPNEVILKITVQSTKDVVSIDRLVTQRFFTRIVTRKDGVDFDDEENPFVTIDPANYNFTNFTRRYFRSVYLTELDTVLGDKAYFAIFKTWFFRNSEFDRFLSENAAKEAGLAIDGVVTPITIPVGQATQSGVVSKPVFAVGLSIDEQQAKVYEILMNSGVIPLEYSQTESTELIPRQYSVNHIEIVLAILVATLILSIYFVIRKDYGQITDFVAPTLLLWAVWTAILKLLQTPVNLSILLLQFMTLTPILSLLSQVKQKRALTLIAVSLLFLLIYLLGIGYVKEFSRDLAVLTLLYYPVSLFVSKYINMSREISR